MRLVVVLRSATPEVTMAFYEGLGMTFTEERHGDGPLHFSAVGADWVLEIYPSTGRQEPMQLGIEGVGAVTDPDGRRLLRLDQ